MKRIARIVANLLVLAFCCSSLGAQGIPAKLLTPRDNPLVLAKDDGTAYVFGGLNDDAGQFLELYDPRKGSVKLAPVVLRPDLPEQTVFFATLLSGDRILVCCGACQVYLPTENRWETRSIPGGATPLVPLNDGQILRAGGSGSGDLWDGTYVVDPATYEAVRTGAMVQGRYTSAVTKLLDGQVLAVGGIYRFPGAGIGFLASAEMFDPATRHWSATLPMKQLSGFVKMVALPTGDALVTSYAGAEIYSAKEKNWKVIPGLAAPVGSAVTVLPNGLVLVSGGFETPWSLDVLSANNLFDPQTVTVRRALPLKIPRAGHALATLADGTVLAVGGTLGAGTPTASVERITWEPSVTGTLNEGFYVAVSSARGSEDGGFTGIEVTTVGQMDGGLNFGGSVSGAGSDVGFAGFYLPEAQTVSASVNFQPRGSGTFEMTVRLLDVNKQLEAAPIAGGTHIEFQKALPAGFHVIELQTGERSPAATYQFALSAPRLSGGAVAGGVLDPAIGAPGFAAFYLPERQDVTIRLYNENTYGARGAGEVILTLYDASGKVVARSGPGVQ